MKAITSALRLNVQRLFQRDQSTQVGEFPSSGGSNRIRLCKNAIWSSDGGSLVEFALIVPMMMALVMGMSSFSIALNSYMVLTNSVGSGARAMALSRGQTVPAISASDPCAYAVQVANNAAPSLNSNSVTYAITWTTYNSSGQAVSTPYTNTCAGVSLNSGDTVQIKATYSAPIVVYGWRPGSIALQAQTAELVQ